MIVNLITMEMEKQHFKQNILIFQNKKIKAQQTLIPKIVQKNLQTQLLLKESKRKYLINKDLKMINQLTNKKFP